MRLSDPRVPALTLDELDADTRGRLGERPPNIFLTLAHHPKLLKRWMVFANHILTKSELPARDRELAILRIGWLCQSGYEWGQHVRIGKRAGLSEAEIERICEGPDAPGWGGLDATLLRATDELHADAFISESTWEVLSKHYSVQQRMDLVFTVGQYNLVCMALNSFGVQLDPGLQGLPATPE